MEMQLIEGPSWTRWLHEVRRMEFEGMMQCVPSPRDSTVLEVGCGDGFQRDRLIERFARVFAIDASHRPGRPAGFAFAVAEALPFPNATFDLVVSSSVIEHLDDRRRGLDEIVRVLRPGGYTAHVVPSRFWKAASLFFNPIGYPLRVAEKWWARRRVVPETRGEALGSERDVQPGVPKVLAQWIVPPIHGTFNSHLSEYRSYGRQQWLEAFAHPRLVPVTDAPLTCATQFGFLRFHFIPLRKRLGLCGFNACRVFVMRRID